jgi:hypothetical protein
MAGTTRLELATSAVTVSMAMLPGARRDEPKWYEGGQDTSWPYLAISTDRCRIKTLTNKAESLAAARQ